MYEYKRVLITLQSNHVHFICSHCMEISINLNNSRFTYAVKYTYTYAYTQQQKILIYKCVNDQKIPSTNTHDYLFIVLKILIYYTCLFRFCCLKLKILRNSLMTQLRKMDLYIVIFVLWAFQRMTALSLKKLTLLVEATVSRVTT